MIHERGIPKQALSLAVVVILDDLAPKTNADDFTFIYDQFSSAYPEGVAAWERSNEQRWKEEHPEIPCPDRIKVWPVDRAE